MYRTSNRVIKLQRKGKLVVFREFQWHDFSLDDVVSRGIVGDVHLRVFADYLRQSFLKPCGKGIHNIIDELLLDLQGALSLGSQFFLYVLQGLSLLSKLLGKFSLLC